MKLSINGETLKEAKSLLERPFESLLPSQDVIADYYAAGETLGVAKGMAQNAGQIIQIVQGRFGIQTGVPSNLISGFANIVSAAAFEQSGTDVGIAIAEASGQLIMDTALKAAGNIPILGWAVQLAMLIAEIGKAYGNQNKPYPPPLRYNKATDDFEANRALEIVGSVHAPQMVDWTPLFLPRRTGFWDAYAAGQGAGTGKGPDTYVFHPMLDEGDGLGCIPPGMFGSRQIQVSGVYEGLSNFQKKKSVPSWYTENVYDAFEFLPSLARIGQAVWSAAGSNETAAVWNLDYKKIRAAWQDYFAKGVELSDFMVKIGKESLKHDVGPHKVKYTPLLQGYSLKNALTNASRISGRILKSKPNPDNNTIAGWSSLWCALYDERAFKMCKTAVVAYADKDQPWFKAHYTHRDALEAGRRDLLEHPAVRALNWRDIPDRDFQFAANARGAGTRSPDDFPNWPAITTSVPQRIPTPQRVSLSATSGGGSGGIVVVGAAALAAGAAYMLTRK